MKSHSMDELKKMEVNFEKRLGKDINKVEDWVRVLSRSAEAVR